MQFNTPAVSHPSRRFFIMQAGSTVLSAAAIGLMSGCESIAKSSDKSTSQDVSILNVALALEPGLDLLRMRAQPLGRRVGDRVEHRQRGRARHQPDPATVRDADDGASVVRVHGQDEEIPGWQEPGELHLPLGVDGRVGDASPRAHDFLGAVEAAVPERVGGGDAAVRVQPVGLDRVVRVALEARGVIIAR